MSDLPITATIVKDVPIYDAMNTLSMRQSWLTGKLEHNGVELGFEMDSGAGLGSPMLQLSVEVVDPKVSRTTREVIDMRDFLRWWLDGHLARRDADEISVFGSARSQNRERTDIRPNEKD
jgi:hypothetical protein